MSKNISREFCIPLTSVFGAWCEESFCHEHAADFDEYTSCFEDMVGVIKGCVDGANGDGDDEYSYDADLEAYIVASGEGFSVILSEEESGFRLCVDGSGLDSEVLFSRLSSVYPSGSISSAQNSYLIAA